MDTKYKQAITKSLETNDYNVISNILNEIDGFDQDSKLKILSNIYIDTNDHHLRSLIISKISPNQEIIYDFVMHCYDNNSTFQIRSFLDYMPIDYSFWFSKYIDHLVKYDKKNTFIENIINELFARIEDIKDKGAQLDYPEALLVCYKLLYEITIHPIKTIKYINQLDLLHQFKEDDLEPILKNLIYNIPYACIDVVDKLENTRFKDLLLRKISLFYDNLNVRKQLKDTYESSVRKSRYLIMDVERNERLTSDAYKSSMFFNLIGNQHSVLFGNQSIFLDYSKEKKIINFNKIEFKLDIPFDYLTNPLEYEAKRHYIKQMKPGDKLP